MFGTNAQGWLALHRQQHAQLIAVAAIARPAHKPRGSRAEPRLAPQPVAGPACATC